MKTSACFCAISLIHKETENNLYFGCTNFYIKSQKIDKTWRETLISSNKFMQISNKILDVGCIKEGIKYAILSIIPLTGSQGSYGTTYSQ